MTFILNKSYILSNNQLVFHYYIDISYYRVGFPLLKDLLWIKSHLSWYLKNLSPIQVSNKVVNNILIRSYKFKNIISCFYYHQIDFCLNFICPLVLEFMSFFLEKSISHKHCTLKDFKENIATLIHMITYSDLHSNYLLATKYEIIIT